MIAFLGELIEGGDSLPFFGDADDGYVLNLGRTARDPRDLLCIGAILFRRPDLKAAAGRLPRAGLVAVRRRGRADLRGAPDAGTGAAAQPRLRRCRLLPAAMRRPRQRQPHQRAVRLRRARARPDRRARPRRRAQLRAARLRHGRVSSTPAPTITSPIRRGAAISAARAPTTPSRSTASTSRQCSGRSCGDNGRPAAVSTGA